MHKALVVDDSRAIRNILSRILSSCGFSVLQAGNGLDALQALGGEAIGVSLICVDHNMPEINGLELVRRVRAIPRFQSVPVIMITTEPHVEFMERALGAGASEYIMKPFTSEMIVEKLRMLGIIAN